MLSSSGRRNWKRCRVIGGAERNPVVREPHPTRTGCWGSREQFELRSRARRWRKPGRSYREVDRQSGSGRYLDACLRDKVKLQRAHGGCLGDKRRRRTWEAAISFGELLTSFDPEISEWDNPRREYLPAYGEYIAIRGQPRELKHLSTQRKRNQLRFP